MYKSQAAFGKRFQGDTVQLLFSACVFMANITALGSLKNIFEKI
jgi:hypothetical protein